MDNGCPKKMFPCFNLFQPLRNTWTFFGTTYCILCLLLHTYYRRQKRSSEPDGDPLADSQAQPQLSMFNLMFKSARHRDIAKILRESTGSSGQRRGKTMIKLTPENLDILEDVETIDLMQHASEVEWVTDNCHLGILMPPEWELSYFLSPQSWQT